MSISPSNPHIVPEASANAIRKALDISPKAVKEIRKLIRHLRKEGKIK